MTASTTSRTEVMAFCSGKGGTGKTSLIAALGFALRSSGHKVLMIDADRATDGFSLFILGMEGVSQISEFNASNTFAGLLDQYERTGGVSPQPRRIDRLAVDDHGLSYAAIISGKALYGDDLNAVGASTPEVDWNKHFDRETFQKAVTAIFDSIRSAQEYDYVLVDTRGGFSYESTDVAAAADSFILVTEATYTNFYQDRNLVDRISSAALQMGTKSLLRGAIVNKSTEPPEAAFRNELVREFGLRFEDTFSVQLDVEAARAYKQHKAVYLDAPACRFSYDSLKAFQQLLRVVTSQWPEERVKEWNALVARVDKAITAHNSLVEERQREETERERDFVVLAAERDAMSKDLALLKDTSDRERERQSILFDELKQQAVKREAQAARELASKDELHRKQEEHLSATIKDLRDRLDYENLHRQVEINQARRLSTMFSAIAAISVVAGVATAVWAITRGGPSSYSPPMLTAASAAAPAYVQPMASSASIQPESTVDASQVSGRPVLPVPSPESMLRYCTAGSYNVIVASHGTRERAEVRAAELRRRYPDFEFATANSTSAKGEPLVAVYAGLGLTLPESRSLSEQLRTAGIADAYVTRQSSDCGGKDIRRPAKN